MGRVIVALSGGKASAWCADWTFRHYPKEDVVLYFNDTKWEDPDLYRFLDDLRGYFNHPITYDADGRSPEEVFYDQRALANNRMPFCSRVLKAERLQRYCQPGDTLVFGIGCTEKHRAVRIAQIYHALKPNLTLRFPLLETFGSRERERESINNFLLQANIQEPALYALGFTHNNCGGGCVRAGKKQWKRLYEMRPEVYLERERVEREVSEHLGKRVTFFKDESLEEFRQRIESGTLSAYYLRPDVEQLTLQLDDERNDAMECIGICGTMN